jgi:cobalamin biosynthesis protein CobD/CbiB
LHSKLTVVLFAFLLTFAFFSSFSTSTSSSASVFVVVAKSASSPSCKMPMSSLGPIMKLAAERESSYGADAAR